jgi:hypothetical protein
MIRVVDPDRLQSRSISSILAQPGSDQNRTFRKFQIFVIKFKKNFQLLPLFFYFPVIKKLSKKADFSPFTLPLDPDS